MKQFLVVGDLNAMDQEVGKKEKESGEGLVEVGSKVGRGFKGDGSKEINSMQW